MLPGFFLLNAIRSARFFTGTFGLTTTICGTVTNSATADRSLIGSNGRVLYRLGAVARYITTVSAKFPTRMVAAASLYGVGIITDKPDSPHLLLNDIKGELYYAFAETDQSVPAHIPGALREALAKTDVKHTLKVFPGTHHGYTFAERMVYHPVASEQTWADMFEMWDRRLK